MLLLSLTARGGRLSTDIDASLNTNSVRAGPQIPRGIALVCLGAENGAAYGVKTGENAALLRFSRTFGGYVMVSAEGALLRRGGTAEHVFATG